MSVRQRHLDMPHSGSRRCERRPHHQESLRGLAKRYGVNPKTVAKWKGRTSVADLPTGPKQPRSTVLSVEEEAVIVAFRRHTLLPLDDCLYALQPTIPQLTRSSLHRCLQRHGVSRLPEVEGKASPKRKFRAYPIGYFHIDIAEVRRQTLPPRRHRQDLEVRLCRTPRDGLPARRRRLPASADRGRPLQGPHGPYRQRNPLHRSRWRLLVAGGNPGDDRRAEALPSACLRICLRHQRYRPQADEAEASMDEWSGRAKEPDDQGRHRQTLLLRIPRPVAHASAGLRQRLQLRQKAQDPQRPHPLRIRL